MERYLLIVFFIAAVIHVAVAGTVCSPALPCGEVMATFDDVDAYSNGEDQCGEDSCNGPPDNGPPGTYGPKYQCTEYIERFYSLKYGIEPENWMVVARNFCTEHPEGVYLAAVPSEPPMPGDIWVQSPESEDLYGHVAMVMKYSPDYDGLGAAVYVIEQNANVSGTNVYPVLGGHRGCFLTANYTHSCNYTAPDDVECGIIVPT